MSLKFLVICVVLVALALPLKAENVQSFDQIAELVVKHRMDLASGLFKVESRVSFGDGDLAGRSRSELIEIYLDAPKRLRATSLRDFGEVGPRGELPNHPFNYSVMRLEDSVYEYAPVDFGSSGNSGKKLAEVFDRVDVSEGLLTDPRLVGLSIHSYQNLRRFKLETVMYHGKYDERYIGGTKEFRGQECVELISIQGDRFSPELKKTVIVAPKLDFNVLQMHLVGKSIDSTLDVEVHEVNNYGWFPRKVMMAETRNGKRGKSSETIITVRDVNRDLDEQVFTLSGMGVPIGAKIYDHRGGKLAEMRLAESGLEPWDESHSDADFSHLARDSWQGWGFRRWLVLITAIIVAAVGIALMIRAKSGITS